MKIIINNICSPLLWNSHCTVFMFLRNDQHGWNICYGDRDVHKKDINYSNDLRACECKLFKGLMKAPSEELNFPRCHSVNAISFLGSRIGVHESDTNGSGYADRYVQILVNCMLKQSDLLSHNLRSLPST